MILHRSHSDAGSPCSHSAVPMHGNSRVSVAWHGVLTPRSPTASGPRFFTSSQTTEQLTPARSRPAVRWPTLVTSQIDSFQRAVVAADITWGSSRHILGSSEPTMTAGRRLSKPSHPSVDWPPRQDVWKYKLIAPPADRGISETVICTLPRFASVSFRLRSFLLNKSTCAYEICHKTQLELPRPGR